MTARKTKATTPSGEELGLKLLQSVREMKARTFARKTEMEVNEVVQARQGTGLSQSEFASALSNSNSKQSDGQILNSRRISSAGKSCRCAATAYTYTSASKRR